jgi:dynein heavy chain
MRFRPYDLAVVPRERLALYSEYFTVSANGVMMVRRGVQAEFVPLAFWVRQASLFDLVSNIGFFKNYITGRAFRRWHKASGHAKLAACMPYVWMANLGLAMCCMPESA